MLLLFNCYILVVTLLFFASMIYRFKIFLLGTQYWYFKNVLALINYEICMDNVFLAIVEHTSLMLCILTCTNAALAPKKSPLTCQSLSAGRGTFSHWACPQTPMWWYTTVKI